MDGASGSIANPGTKNTGNHFANTLAPGVNVAKILSPRPGLIISDKTIATKRMQQPPNWDGKLMPYLTNNFLKR